MSYTNIVVDHMKLDYKGPFNLSEMFRLNDKYLFERGYEKRTNKNYELASKNGKFVEWEVASWKKISSYIRAVFQVRYLIYELQKIDVIQDNKNVQMDHGHVIIYIDLYIEFDFEHRWDGSPLLVFIRTMFDRFIYHSYTERFEQRLTVEAHHFYDELERFFNMYREFKVVSRAPLFNAAGH